ncbi:hypothetical protein [Aeromonas hydrophila]|uniref:hypothetical protein n=1 Tax=Aeromonas hydrophila TaxID=644 RepID=UPI002B4BD0D6|nr:hypothetical protein [Aeromonas hydrophila]WRK93487.1 hypothetical protein U8518_07395 [Aeromonas hydrophila]
MTVPNKPFWLSAAHNEFGGNRWMSDTANRAGLPAPCLLGDLAGRSASTHRLTIGSFIKGDLQLCGFAGTQGSLGPLNPMGSIAPPSFDGKTLVKCSTSSRMPDILFVECQGQFPIGRRVRVVVSGLGSMEVTTINYGNNYCTLPLGTIVGIHNWFAARIGQTVPIDLVVVR